MGRSRLAAADLHQRRPAGHRLGPVCLHRPGDGLIVEEATFSGIKALAAHMTYQVVGARLDAEGLTPEGLDEAVARTGARAVYLQPLQNPTGRIMSLERRRAILDVARRRGVMIVEDDLYSAYAGADGPADPVPLARLAPDQVFYVNGLSKSLTPGLRMGYLIPPAGGDWTARALAALRAIAFGPPGIGGLNRGPVDRGRDGSRGAHRPPRRTRGPHGPGCRRPRRGRRASG